MKIQEKNVLVILKNNTKMADSKLNPIMKCYQTRILMSLRVSMVSV